jgi:uncharacterized protein (DUF2147 family)
VFDNKQYFIEFRYGAAACSLHALSQRLVTAHMPPFRPFSCLWTHAHFGALFMVPTWKFRVKRVKKDGRTGFGSPAMRLLLAAFAVALMAPMGASADPVGNPETDPTGEWLVAKRVARIKIINCDNRLWGLVSWEMTPGGVDSNNPDAAKRAQPTLGMPVLLGMEQIKPNEWKGEIYNAQDGRNYSSSISLLSPDLLKVQGCVLGFLCGGENWTRVIPPLIASPPPPPKKSAKTANPPPPDQALCLDVVARAGPSH